jgi:hypothetical protein
MATMAKHTWRDDMCHSRLCVLVYNDHPKNDAFFRERVAYAMGWDKPIRLLVMPGSRVPEDLCAGYGDLAIALVTHTEADGDQVRRWLAEVEERG